MTAPPRFVDYAPDAPRNTWRHPQTGVVIADEHMPDELRPGGDA